MVIGVQAAPSMCDVGIQCDLLCPPLISTPRVTPVVEDADPFELTEEESEETTKSTFYCDRT